MTRIHTVILVSCIALLLAVSGIVTAQETTTAFAPTETTAAVTPTTAPKSSNETTYYGDAAGDHAVRTVPAEYVDEIVVLVFKSDLPRMVTVTAPTGLTLTGATAGNLIRRPIPPGRTTTRINSSEPRVTLVTSCSVENGRYTEIRFDDGGSALIVGPFTGIDVRDVAIGGVFGTLFGASPIIVRWRFGLHCGMEYVA